MKQSTMIKTCVFTVLCALATFCVPQEAAAENVVHENKALGYEFALPAAWTDIPLNQLLEGVDEQLLDTALGPRQQTTQSGARDAATLRAVFERTPNSPQEGAPLLVVATVDLKELLDEDGLSDNRSGLFAGMLDGLERTGKSFAEGRVREMMGDMNGGDVLLDTKTMEVVIPLNSPGGQFGHAFRWIRVTRYRMVVLAAVFPSDDWTTSQELRRTLADSLDVAHLMPRTEPPEDTGSSAQEVGFKMGQVTCWVFMLVIGGWFLWSTGLFNKRNFEHLAEDDEEDKPEA